jgi:hypothetical protein
MCRGGQRSATCEWAERWFWGSRGAQGTRILENRALGRQMQVRETPQGGWARLRPCRCNFRVEGGGGAGAVAGARRGVTHRCGGQQRESSDGREVVLRLDYVEPMSLQQYLKGRRGGGMGG